MTSEEYIKTFRMDQPNFRFNRKAFMETFGTEFLNQVYAHKPNPKTGVLTYNAFRKITFAYRAKFQEISKLRKKAVNAPLTEKLWGVFYSTFVVKERIRLFPRVQEKIENAKLNSLGQRAIIKPLKKGNGVAHIN